MPHLYLSGQPRLHTTPLCKDKAVKNRSFWKGVDIYLDATDKTLCPVKAILPYLAIRPDHPNSPLFMGGLSPTSVSATFWTLDSLVLGLTVLSTTLTASEMEQLLLQRKQIYHIQPFKCWEDGRVTHTRHTLKHPYVSSPTSQNSSTNSKIIESYQNKPQLLLLKQQPQAHILTFNLYNCISY